MSTLATIPVPTAIYREDQLFAWWSYAVLAGVLGIGCVLLTRRPAGVGFAEAPGMHLVIAACLGLPPLLIVGLLRMTTLVAAGSVSVGFGFLPFYRRQIGLDEVSQVEVVTYRPIADWGGWGIRIGRSGDRALTARGRRGVLLSLGEGGTILIGSQTPEALASAMKAEMLPQV